MQSAVPIAVTKKSAAVAKKRVGRRKIFEEVAKKKHPKVRCSFGDYFNGTRAYQVRLFKAQPYFVHDDASRKAWNTQPTFSYAHRIKLLFALYYQNDRESGIREAPEHGLLLLLPEAVKAQLDESYASKLDLHHLFVEGVDTCLSSCGLFEDKTVEVGSQSFQSASQGRSTSARICPSLDSFNIPLNSSLVN